MAKKTIIIATREISGGTKAGGGEKLRANEELTAAAKKSLGLSNDDVDDLVARGALIEVPAHIAERGGSDDAKAATARAEKAEAELAEANAKVAKLEEDNESLTAQLEAASAAAAKA